MRRNYDKGMMYAREEGERAERLKEQGLCLDCADNPINPHLSGHVCLDCWESHEAIGCMVSGCPNSTDGNFRQMSLCNIHLADSIQNHYTSYIEKKDQIEQDRQELFDKAEETDVDPQEITSMDYSKLERKAKDIHDEWVDLEYQDMGLSQLRKDIQKAIDQCDKAFPDEYEVFG